MTRGPMCEISNSNISELNFDAIAGNSKQNPISFSQSAGRVERTGSARFVGILMGI